jgi:hypothetical protein
MLRFLKMSLITLALSSCAAISKKESPVIYFSNSSPDLIKDIRCNWAGRHALTLSRLIPGESRSQSFYLEETNDFFGPIKISWQNGRGERLSHEFELMRKHLPGINEADSYNYIQIYFDQEGIEVASSDEVDLSNKNQRRDADLLRYNKNYVARHAITNMALIVEDPKERVSQSPNDAK